MSLLLIDEKIHCNLSHTSTLNALLCLSVPVNFDHFQILRAIGKGSFGKVCDHLCSVSSVTNIGLLCE